MRVPSALRSRKTRSARRRDAGPGQSAASAKGRGPEAAVQIPAGSTAATQPPEHDRFESDLLRAVGHAYSDERGVGLGGDTVDRLAKRRVHAVALHSRRARLGPHALRQWQARLDRAETADWVRGDREERRARLKAVWRRGRAAQLGHESVAPAVAADEEGPSLGQLGQIVQRE